MALLPEESLIHGLLIVLGYILLLTAAYLGLRKQQLSIPVALAIAVPLAQCLLSAIFQFRLLSGLVYSEFILCAALFAGALWFLSKSLSKFRADTRELKGLLLAHPLSAGLPCAALVYGLAQAFFLPVTNHDALAYHLPRVFLFIQNDSFFLEFFSMHHQVIFPVGADILFYPFVRSNTLNGAAIFSLSSYLALFAFAYAIARHFCDHGKSIVCAAVMVSLPCLVLQSASLKNDIIMASTAAASLIVLTNRPFKSTWLNLIVLGLLCAFGISVKTTFLALLPGLGLVAISQLELYKRKTWTEIFSLTRQFWPQTTITVVGILFLAQTWLFAWNVLHHETWSGPESFTHRNVQHDGLKGAMANATRYALQTLHVGPISNLLVADSLSIPAFTDQLNDFYADHMEPVIGTLGATREPFHVAWVTDEDHAWFGPAGAIIFYIAIPFALIVRTRSVALILVPAVSYFIMLCATVSWMPWNGRFFSTFFILCTPALAVLLSRINCRFIIASLAVISALTLATVKLTDARRPAITLASDLFMSDGARPWEVARKSLSRRDSAWSPEHRNSPVHRGEPSVIVNEMPRGARVGIFLQGHTAHYGFYSARPDLQWVPLNYHLDDGKLNPKDAIEYAYFNLDYFLIMGLKADNDVLLLKKSSDGFASLFGMPSSQFNQK